MRVFLWCVFGFAVGVAAGYVAIFYGWMVFSQHFHVFDDDGSKVMQVQFAWAPIGGLLFGLSLAFRLALRAARRSTGRRDDGG
jgi:hypothetical protein